MIVIKNDEEIALMRESGRIAARVRDKVAQKIAPGISTLELGKYGGALISEYGAENAFLGYRGFPGELCISVNEAVVHGIPGEQIVKLGDIVSIDVGVKYMGYMGDTATTVMVAVVDEQTLKLVKATENALEAGIQVCVEGRRLSDVSHAIEKVAVNAGFSVVRDFVGHGIGRDLHEDPQIPNFGEPGKGVELKAGMTFCLEPMINMGAAEVDIQPDGWTVLTRDRLPSAHSEHMVVVGKEKAEILTL